jgi:hypothetical protein
MTTPNFTWTCAHCGQRCGDTEGGYGAITGRDGAIHASCSPSVKWRPNCYERVTKHGEPVGALIGVEPKPAGIQDIRSRG